MNQNKLLEFNFPNLFQYIIQALIENICLSESIFSRLSRSFIVEDTDFLFIFD